MRIESSQVDYGVDQRFTAIRQQSDRLRLERRDAAPQETAKTLTVADLFGDSAPAADDPKTLFAKLVIQALLGGNTDLPQIQLGSGTTHAPSRGANQQQWSVAVSHQEIYQENESLTVKARGAVKTADGREIRFSAEFALARSFRIESGSSASAGAPQVKDPLFLDTGGGQSLLVRDTDGNGAVSGSGELFGAQTGDGFGELAMLDSDGNGWIDSGDPVFGQLRLQLGDGSMETLESLGIGALSTSGAAGEFHYTNEANEITAIVRRTGVYLMEDGRAGALRQIDLVV